MTVTDRRQRGQLVILLLLILPVLVTSLIVFGRIAVVVVTKARLQVAADRAAQAAGEVLATTMDQLAKDNWAIHHEFREQEREFIRSQQQSAAGGEQKLRHRQLVIDQLRRQMRQALNAGYTQACQKALAVATQEVPWAEVIPLYGGTRIVAGDTGQTCVADHALFSFFGDAVHEDQWQAQTFTYPSGGMDWEDPANIDDGRGDLLRYRTKATGPDQQVAFALRLRAPTIFADTWIAASAAAQPIGGSIEETAFVEVESPESLDAEWEEAGLGYEPTLVPLDRLQRRELGYQGLRYFDPTEGWVEDEAFYLQ